MKQEKTVSFPNYAPMDSVLVTSVNKYLPRNNLKEGKVYLGPSFGGTVLLGRGEHEGRNMKSLVTLVLSGIRGSMKPLVTLCAVWNQKEHEATGHTVCCLESEGA